MKLPCGKSRWWTVVASTLGLSVSNGPLIQYSFGTFLKPLGEEFHVDRGTLSTAVLVACRVVQGAGAALLLPSSLALVTLLFEDPTKPRSLAIRKPP